MYLQMFSRCKLHAHNSDLQDISQQLYKACNYHLPYFYRYQQQRILTLYRSKSCLGIVLLWYILDSCCQKNLYLLLRDICKGCFILILIEQQARCKILRIKDMYALPSHLDAS